MSPRPDANDEHADVLTDGSSPGLAGGHDPDIDDDDDAPVDPAAADPDEPRTEGAAESLGRSISEVVTGPVDDDKVDRGMPREPGGRRTA